MTKSLPYRVIATFLALPLSAAFAQSAPTGEEAALLAADIRQRQAIGRGDVEAMAALTHPSFHANAPSNRVLTREQVLSMIKSGAIAAQRFERTLEAVTITGNVGVIMGNEVILPTADSAPGKAFGLKSLKRRFTNVYIRDGGSWRLLARHANVVAKPEAVATTR